MKMRICVQLVISRTAMIIMALFEIKSEVYMTAFVEHNLLSFEFAFKLQTVKQI